MRRYLQFIGLLLLTACVVSPSAHADDDVKRLIGGLAVGIVGQMLESASEQEQQTQPASNDMKQVKAVTSTAPKLEYSQDVADIQSKLKQVGFYDGAVDGLKGQNTIVSINRWEEVFSEVTQPPKFGPFYKLGFGLLLSLKKGDYYEPRKALYSGTNNQDITRS